MGPGPGRLGQKPGCLRRASAEGTGQPQPEAGRGAEAFWPPQAPVAPWSPAGRAPGSGRSPPRPAAAPPGDPAGGARRALPMAGYEVVSVSGFEEFSRAVEQHHGKTIFAYFTGSKDAGGKSWCPDCVQAEPVVREGLKHVSEGCVFIYCQVGEKPYWKDPNNDFRKNLKVTAVPTLLKYGTPQKLVESECLQANLVEMLFSED
ncbi:thioredoxin domain-containing protein 17 [Leopardus geoffroyi]|uniref:thioredoxin domain-containing protein 17 n=1 Tax=Leopardus geoffroyi TaxID=46844 RepID=UPI001E26346F|nr:thioredoxin domain-containing protein 17 [Leopardus geoffroyi]